jgi:hypothetical protein
MIRQRLLAAAAFAVALGVALAGAPATATPDARGEREIAHLLDFVAASGCRFVRAGTEYDSRAARDHLAGKYGQVRSRVDSAEQFIVYVASTSSITGGAYLVRCEGRESTSRLWLEVELKRYRGESAGAK